MKLDMHIHSSYSRDASASPDEILTACKKAGLDGCAITDHNTVEGSFRASSMGKHHELLVVRGVEVSSIDGHILAYGVRESIPKRLSIEETIEKIVAAGGVPVAAHPKRFPSGIGLDAASKNKFQGIEVLNGGNSTWNNRAARKVAEAMKVAKIGGSDAHKISEIGRSYTIFENVSTEDDVLSAISSAVTSADGRSRTAIEGMVYAGETLLEWLRGGLKRQ